MHSLPQNNQSENYHKCLKAFHKLHPNLPSRKKGSLTAQPFSFSLISEDHFPFPLGHVTPSHLLFQLPGEPLPSPPLLYSRNQLIITPQALLWPIPHVSAQLQATLCQRPSYIFGNISSLVCLPLYTPFMDGCIA